MRKFRKSNFFSSKKAQDIGSAISLATFSELVIGVTVAIFFIVAANQFVDGNVSSKKYFASDVSRIIDTMHALPGNGFMIYNAPYEFKINKKTLSVKIDNKDPNSVEALFVPFFENDEKGAVSSNPIIRKYGDSVSLSSDIPQKYVDRVYRNLNFKDKNVSNVVFVYDDLTKDYLKDMKDYFNNGKVSASPKEAENTVYVFIKKSDKFSFKYSSMRNKDERLVNFEFLELLQSELLQKRIVDIKVPISLVSQMSEFKHAVMIGIPELNDKIKQQIAMSVGGYYKIQ